MNLDGQIPLLHRGHRKGTGDQVTGFVCRQKVKRWRFRRTVAQRSADAAFDAILSVSVLLLNPHVLPPPPRYSTRETHMPAGPVLTAVRLRCGASAARRFIHRTAACGVR